MLNGIFTDNASLVIRELLAHPDRNWVVRDLVDELNVSQGLVAKVLKTLRARSFLKGEPRGRLASATLRNADELLLEWVKHYEFGRNEAHAYYSADPDILPQIKKALEKGGWGDAYALTLHSGANLITSYVHDPNVYLYLKADLFEKISLALRKALDLKELKAGGNVHLLFPYYKRSAFFRARKMKGYSVVSNLQSYLDLYHFPQRGQEHAEYLVRTLKEKGETLA